MAELEREVLVNWLEGDCVFRMSVPINRGPPSRRPMITGDLILIVDGYRADGRRQAPHIRVILAIGLLDATRLAIVPFARNDVVHEVVGAWSSNSFRGNLPDDLVLILADALSLFFRDVAGEMDAAPDITYVSAVARVRLFDEGRDQEVAEEVGEEEEVAMEEEEGDGEEVAMQEEEEEEGNGVEMEEEKGEEPSSTTAPPEREEETEGEEETRCAICLRRMASGAAAEGRQERWWLPCCHSFHRGCLQRWLRQKAECPLCRAPAAASAGGGGGQQRDSS